MRNGERCYKHKFYGIVSRRCIQMTTSLACANRCVFCWRHHTVPVSRDWKWKLDTPEEVVEQSIAAQRKAIKEMRGVPGVTPESMEEGMTPRHAALSLVGESVLYPQVNEVIDQFHERGISTFLVTNGQFPETLKTLRPVTQLYLSVDAADEESLRRIDRPLFRDAWDRLLASLDILARYRSRTTIRLTAIKDVNMNKPEAYAALIRRGHPDFVEIKGYSHIGGARDFLRIENTPWHFETVEFADKVAAELAPEYIRLSHHPNSLTVLLVRTSLYPHAATDDSEAPRELNQWPTWIDFEAFFQQIRQEKEAGTHTACVPTPEELASLDPAAPRPPMERLSYNRPGPPEILVAAEPDGEEELMRRVGPEAVALWRAEQSVPVPQESGEDD
eukprot:gnl/Trimastix_PCT/3389.p1 GENE.gnl/Trimastix_PCT/3389~~gnl/Trimastix_PCT/3389.p1  ORF type:complete len:389 (+),score=124.51 gnl/Trimastix_PCT/3389:193-1359(+)